MPKGVSNNITNISGTIRNNTKMYGRVINGQQFVSTVLRGWTDNPTDAQKILRVKWRIYNIFWPLYWEYLQGWSHMQKVWGLKEAARINDAFYYDFSIYDDPLNIEGEELIDSTFKPQWRFDWKHKQVITGMDVPTENNPPDGGYIKWMWERMEAGEYTYQGKTYKSLKALAKGHIWGEINYLGRWEDIDKNWRGKFIYLGFDWFDVSPKGYDELVMNTTPRGLLKNRTKDPSDGGGSTPPDDGGGTTPPDDGGGGGTTNPPDDGGGTTPPPAEPSTSRPGDSNSKNFQYRAIDTGVDYNGMRIWITDRYAGASSPEAIGDFFTKTQYINGDPAGDWFGSGWTLIDDPIQKALLNANSQLNPQQTGDRAIWHGKEDIIFMNSGYMSDGSLTGTQYPYFWGAQSSGSMFQIKLNPVIEYNYVSRSSLQSQVRAVKLEDTAGDGSEGSEGGDSGGAVNRTINEYLERAGWLKGDGGHYVSSYRPIAGSNTNKAPDVTIKAKLRVSQFASNVGTVTNICGSSIVSDGIRFRKSNLAIRAKSAYTFEVGYFAAVANVAEDLKFYGEYSMDDVLTIEATAQEMTINGKSYTLENENNNNLGLVDLIVMYAGSSNGGRSYGGELAYIEYWSKGVCNSQLIPCKVTKELPASMANTATAQPVGAVGLWDTKNEKFMTSSAANTWQAVND